MRMKRQHIKDESTGGSTSTVNLLNAFFCIYYSMRFVFEGKFLSQSLKMKMTLSMITSEE